MSLCISSIAPPTSLTWPTTTVAFSITLCKKRPYNRDILLNPYNLACEFSKGNIPLATTLNTSASAGSSWPLLLTGWFLAAFTESEQPTCSSSCSFSSLISLLRACVMESPSVFLKWLSVVYALALWHLMAYGHISDCQLLADKDPSIISSVPCLLFFEHVIAFVAIWINSLARQNLSCCNNDQWITRVFFRSSSRSTRNCLHSIQ